MNPEWMFIALSWVFVLACPLAMIWMMRGMHGAGSRDELVMNDFPNCVLSALPRRERSRRDPGAVRA